MLMTDIIGDFKDKVMVWNNNNKKWIPRWRLQRAQVLTSDFNAACK